MTWQHSKRGNDYLQVGELLAFVKESDDGYILSFKVEGNFAEKDNAMKVAEVILGTLEDNELSIFE